MTNIIHFIKDDQHGVHFEMNYDDPDIVVDFAIQSDGWFDRENALNSIKAEIDRFILFLTEEKAKIDKF